MPPLIIATALTLVTLNSWHVLSEWFLNKPYELFTGIAHYYGDYFLYTSHIAQGASHLSIFTQHLFTNETLRSTWIYWFNTLLGIWTHVGLNVFAIYNVALVGIAFLLLYILWVLVTHIFPSKPTLQIVAFICITTASNFVNVKTGSLIADFWFSPTPALNRLGGVPHQMFQTMLLLVSIMFFAHLLSAYKKLSFRHLLAVPTTYFLIISAFLSSTANPIHMLLVSMSATLACIILYKKSRIHYLPLLFLLIPSLLGALITNREFIHQPVLTAAKLWEDGQNIQVSPLQFFLSLGPIGLLLPFGMKRYIKNLSPIRILIGLYTLLSLGIFFSSVPQMLTTTPVRWIGPASFLLLPILATEGLVAAAQFFHKLSHKKASITFWFTIMLILYILFTVPSLMRQIQARTLSFATDRNIHLINHVPKNIIDGLTTIKLTRLNGVVLTDPELPIDVLVPTFTLHKTFTGHPIHTLYPHNKAGLQHAFFSQKMSTDEMTKFFRDHNIIYIIASPKNASYIEQLPNVLLVTRNETMTVFIVH